VVDVPESTRRGGGDDLDVGRWLDEGGSFRGAPRERSDSRRRKRAATEPSAPPGRRSTPEGWSLSCWASAGILRALAHIVSTLLLSLRKAKACFGLLAGPLELAQACRAGGSLSVGLRFVELVALAGVVSLRSQIVKVIGGHALAALTSCAVSGVAVTRVNGGQVYARSPYWAGCSSARSGDRGPTHPPGRAPRHAARCWAPP
jgi:hypothetical protein